MAERPETKPFEPDLGHTSVGKRAKILRYPQLPLGWRFFKPTSGANRPVEPRGIALSRHAVLFMLVAAALAGRARADTLQGRVVDRVTGAPVAAVEVRVIGAPRVVLTNQAGEFTVADVSDSDLEIELLRFGYLPAHQRVSRAGVASSGGTLEVRLEPLAFQEDPVIVSAARVQRRESPIPHSELTHAELQERYTTQDLPVLLAALPSSIYYSESGNGIGYNYLTLRGFDQRRISVLVNGVPQNDPEDQNVYWLDFPDLAANLQDVQVQRGAGSGFYGPPAIGGAVNLATAAFDPQPGVRVQTGAGSFGTRKSSLQLNSGLVNGVYAFSGRYSRLLSDGYRQDSWTDFTSFFFGAARYDAHLTTRIHVYGGPLSDGLAYYGVPGTAVHDRVARRQNALAGGAQIENFSQPHYELLSEWRPNAKVRVVNTLFYVQGDGFFDFDGSFADTTYYRLTGAYGFRPATNPGRSLIRASVANKQAGWLPRVEWQHANGELTVGAELRRHRSDHWGQIRWAEALPAGLDPERKYYRYRGGKDILGAYAHEVLHATERLQVTGDLQLVYDRYRIFDEDFAATTFAQPYVFANPRFGVNYNANQSLHGYASYGYVQREPRLKNLYDAAESSGGATPQYDTLSGGGVDFDQPLVHPEKLHDFELGAGWRQGTRATAAVNLFWMDFHDEIVSNGQLDRFGQPVTGNAARSVHRGIELEARVRPVAAFEVEGNLSWSQNRFRDHRVFVDAGGSAIPAGVQLGGNEIAGFPSLVSNLRGTLRGHGATVALAARGVGEFFTTNFENASERVPGHFVLDAEAAYELPFATLRRTRLQLQVRNVLDQLYVLHGEGDQFFPAATRNFFASVEFGL